MSLESLIEWTKITWNFLIGCTKKSKGCMHCYAIRQAWRLMHNPNPKIAKKYEGTVAKDSKGELNWTGRVNFDEETLLLPLKVKEPSMIFADSMSDMFHPNVKDEWLDKAFAVMALCQWHTFQIVTKHPDRMLDYLTNHAAGGRHIWVAAQNIQMPRGLDKPEPGWPLPNVWLLTSTEDQATADERIPYLLHCPAAVRGISAEPLLGPLDITRWLKIAWQCSGCREYFSGPYQKACPTCGRVEYWTGSHTFNPKGGQVGSGLHWVIAGGESGPDARPSHPDWFISLRDQCESADVKFFFKQWGAWAPAYVLDHAAKLPRRIEHIHMNMAGVCPGVESNIIVNRVGKKHTGRVLDGRTWDEFPEVAWKHNEG